MGSLGIYRSGIITTPKFSKKKQKKDLYYNAPRLFRSHQLSKHLKMANGKKYNDTIVDEKNNIVEMNSDDDIAGVFDIYSHENPYSVLNTIPNVLKDSVNKIPQELREMTVEEMRDLVTPNKTLNQLRLKFWKEYDSIIGQGGRKKMSIPKIIAGICSVPVFRSIMANPTKAAWILTPVSAYSIGVEELMETTLSKLRKKIDSVDINSTKDLSVLLKIFEVFDKRVHGDYKQTKEVTVTSTLAPGNSNEIRHAIEVKKNLLIED